MRQFIAWLSLFASTGTLFCCALPSLLVVLGMGATMAGIVTTVPQIVWLSQYKFWVFAFSGSMIALAAMGQYLTRNEPCPIDPIKAKACGQSRRWALYILTFAGSIWSIGAFFAFVAPRIFA